MSIATASDFELAPAPARPLLIPLLLAAAGVALADWLFYGWDVGISLALFLGVLGIAGVACNRAQANARTTIIMAVVFVAGLAAPDRGRQPSFGHRGHAGNGAVRQHRDGSRSPSWQRNCSKP